MAASVKPARELHWHTVGEGGAIAVLRGDPASAGDFFVIRFRTEKATQVPVHWHATDEEITVLRGPFGFRLESETAFRTLDDGAFVFVPAGQRHATDYGVGTIVQVSGVGPFETLYADPPTMPLG